MAAGSGGVSHRRAALPRGEHRREVRERGADVVGVLRRRSGARGAEKAVGPEATAVSGQRRVALVPRQLRHALVPQRRQVRLHQREYVVAVAAAVDPQLRLHAVEHPDGRAAADVVGVERRHRLLEVLLVARARRHRHHHRLREVAVATDEQPAAARRLPRRPRRRPRLGLQRVLAGHRPVVAPRRQIRRRDELLHQVRALLRALGRREHALGALAEPRARHALDRPGGRAAVGPLVAARRQPRLPFGERQRRERRQRRDGLADRARRGERGRREEHRGGSTHSEVAKEVDRVPNVSVRAPIRTGDPIRTELIQTSEDFAARSPRPSALLQCNARDREAHNAPNPTQNGQGTRKWQQKWCARTARRRFLRPIQPAACTCAQALRGFKIGRRGPHRCSACLEPRLCLSTHDCSPHCPDICAHAVRRPHADRSAQRV